MANMALFLGFSHFFPLCASLDTLVSRMVPLFFLIFLQRLGLRDDISSAVRCEMRSVIFLALLGTMVGEMEAREFLCGSASGKVLGMKTGEKQRSRAGSAPCIET
jgi:hypothetical protein